MIALKVVDDGEDPIVNCGELSKKGAVIVEVLKLVSSTYKWHVRHEY